ncbi:MAG: DNA recombination protein RmuC, partial [Nitrospirae bacterium]|nr:DNA recombination protein RmuC [Candidatus Manganitrophaceae bacterium]
MNIFFIVTALCFLILGIVLGGFYFRLHFRGKESQATDRLRANFEKKIAVLDERLGTREQNLNAASMEIIALKEEGASLQKDLTALKVNHSSLEMRLEKEQKAAEEKLAILNEAKKNLSDAFKALSADALKSNNQMFLEVAKSSFDKLKEGAEQDLIKRQVAIDQVVKPVKEGLDKFDQKIQALEKARVGAYEGLNQQVKSLIDSQIQLRSETTNLVNALRKPQVRGRWGEIQLKRVVEIAGMLNHCDFKEQYVVGDEGNRLRPDMVVNLPGGKTIVVDAKVPLTAYLEGQETQDETLMQTKRKEHARRIREHISELSRK